MQIELLKFPYSYMEYEKILQIRERKVLLPEIEVLSDDKHNTIISGERINLDNTRGTKNTFSCIINMNYIDLNLVQEARVTFEADNNLDFRLGTGAFRYTKKAKENDLALITRLSEYDYEMRIVSTEDKKYTQLSAYATSYIGNYGKRFGYIANSELFNILDK